MTDLATRLAYPFTTTAVVTATTVQASSLAIARAVAQPAAGTMMALGGRSSVNDGGQGTFVWDATSTATDDGALTIAVSGVTTGRWKRVYSGPIDVRWFGAVGDGTTDDTTAVQNAIDAARSAGVQASVYFSPGTYKVTSALTVTCTSPLTLLGDGDLSVVSFTAVDDGFVGTNLTAFFSVRRLKIAGSYARAISIDTASSGLEIVDCDISGATRIPSSGFQSPIRVVSTDDVWIADNYIHDCGQSGTKTASTYAISAGGTGTRHRWHITGNVILGAGTTIQLGLFDLAESEIVNNTIDGASTDIFTAGADGYGIVLYSLNGACDRNRIAGNTVRNCPGSGIYVKASTRTIVEGNIVDSCASKMTDSSLGVGGISVHSSAGIIVRSNRIHAAGGSRVDGLGGTGIVCTAGFDDAQIAGNIITSAVKYGIWLRSGTNYNLQITGNTVTNLLGSGNHAIYANCTAANSSISGNKVSNVAGGGLIIDNATECGISGNEIDSLAGSQGLLVTAGSNSRIIGNGLSGCSNDGLQVQGTAHLVQGNRVRACGARGIYESGTNNRVLDNDCAGNNTLAAGWLNLQVAGSNTEARGNVRASQAATRRGSVALVAGASGTISNAEVLAASTSLRVTRKTSGGTLGHLSYAIPADGQFTITSSSATDTSVIEWEIVH